MLWPFSAIKKRWHGKDCLILTFLYIRRVCSFAISRSAAKVETGGSCEQTSGGWNLQRNVDQAGFHHPTSTPNVATALAFSPSSNTPTRGFSQKQKVELHLSTQQSSTDYSFNLIQFQKSQDLFRFLVYRFSDMVLLTTANAQHIPWCVSNPQTN
jgi:hypothetical protein